MFAQTVLRTSIHRPVLERDSTHMDVPHLARLHALMVQARDNYVPLHNAVPRYFCGARTKYTKKYMAQIFLMPMLKFVLDFFCFFTAGLVFFSKILETQLYRFFNLTPSQNSIVLSLSAIFLVVRIVWFIYEKAWLDRREREKRRKMEMDIMEKILSKKVNRRPE